METAGFVIREWTPRKTLESRAAGSVGVWRCPSRGRIDNMRISWPPQGARKKKVKNMNFEQVKEDIYDIVMHSEHMRIRSNDLEKSVSRKYGMHRYVVAELLKDMLEEERLVFSYRDPCSYVEIPPAKPQRAARPMEIVRDKNGDCWLCDKGVDPEKDLKEQGCWQCAGQEMPFTRQD
jgi:hypothetical protein